ncbi:hypothetical protein PHSY_002640 [Pseudozyma hubeiensis SY62]|uniref:Uncharacterized protein n=1 Tax=Pseudozyma hubeiensis (strain SY62) TaxID=1305764 RepID=R9PAD6_PSEHS|nr:hypothetical protein PHSY_002640 [Pseudozyma hubeiensis SY62]GAC95065.1 hypothetical protein PHSY_002640 [Pseudozyma hubeiensis SY62]
MFRRTLALFSEAARSSASTPSSSADILTSHLSKAHLPPSLARSAKPHKNLYQLLSALPNDGVGTRVRQRRWAAKGLDVKHDLDLKAHLTKLHQTSAGKSAKEEGHLCYWEITKTQYASDERESRPTTKAVQLLCAEHCASRSRQGGANPVWAIRGFSIFDTRSVEKRKGGKRGRAGSSGGVGG